MEKRKTARLAIGAVLGLVLIAVLFHHFFVISLSPYTMARVERFDKKYQVTTDSTKQTLIAFHTRVTVMRGNEFFSMTGYFYAPDRKEKVLKNTYQFYVNFPSSQMAARDTAALFSRIRARAYLALQQASACVDQNFYGPNPEKLAEKLAKSSTEKLAHDWPYPEIFEYYLNHPGMGYAVHDPLNSLCFHHADVKKILYDSADKQNAIKSFTIFCQSYLLQSRTLESYQRDIGELSKKFNVRLTNFAL